MVGSCTAIARVNVFFRLTDQCAGETAFSPQLVDRSSSPFSQPEYARTGSRHREDRGFARPACANGVVARMPGNTACKNGVEPTIPPLIGKGTPCALAMRQAASIGRDHRIARRDDANPLNGLFAGKIILRQPLSDGIYRRQWQCFPRRRRKWRCIHNSSFYRLNLYRISLKDIVAHGF